MNRKVKYVKIIWKTYDTGDNPVNLRKFHKNGFVFKPDVVSWKKDL